MRGLTVGTAGLPVNLIKQQKAYLFDFPTAARHPRPGGGPHRRPGRSISALEAAFDSLRGTPGRKPAVHSCITPAGSDV